MALIHVLSLTALISTGFIRTTYSQGGEGESSSGKAEIKRPYAYVKKAKEIRERAVQNRQCCPLDLMLVVDVSLGIAVDDFEDIKSFMKDNVLASLDLDSISCVRVGLVSFDRMARSVFTLSNLTRAEIENEIDDLSTDVIPGSDVASGMTVACNEFNGPGNRPDVPNIVIVITYSGQDSTPTEINNARTCLETAGVETIIAIAIGPNVDMNQMELVTGDPDRVFKTGFVDLLALVVPLMPLCNNKRCCHNETPCEVDSDCVGKDGQSDLCCDRNEPFCCCPVARRSPCHNNHCCNAGCGCGCGCCYQAPCGCNSNCT